MFKAVLKGDIAKKDPKKSACILPISVGQKYHENDKFKATVDLINATFGECTIVIADTLGRHTALKESEQETVEEIQQRLRKNGDKWIERNNEALKKLTIQHKIVRWDEYIQHVGYKAKRDQIESLYNSDQPFKKATEGSIAKFLRRYKQQQPSKDHDIDKAFADSLEYVKEECAVLLLWPDIEHSDFLIYPNKLHEAMYNLRRRFIAPDNGDSTALQSLVVDFKKIKQSIELQPHAVGQENGHAYVPELLSAGYSQINAASFFRAQPPCGIEMSKQEFTGFTKNHIELMFSTMKDLEAPRQQAFLTYYLAQFSQLASPITVVDDTDSSSDSSEHDISPGLSPDDDPADTPQLLQIDNTK